MKKKKAWFWIIAYLLVLLGLGTIIYVLPTVAGLFDRTYVAKYGEIEVACEVEGCLVREETLYTADRAGTVTREVKEGTLVKGDQTVVTFSGKGNDKKNDRHTALLKKLGKNAPEAKNGVTPVSGYISYQVDGLEYLNESALLKLTGKSYDKLGDGKQTELPSGKVAKGDPVFKLVENGNWWLVFYTDKETAERFAEGASVTVRREEEEMTAVVEQVKASDDRVKIVLHSGTYYKDYLTDRAVSVTVLTARADGVVLESGSIIEKGGRKGVLTKNKVGKLIFKPVSIKADNGEEAAVYGDYYMDSEGNFVETVNPYDEVVKSPSKKDIKESKGK